MRKSDARASPPRLEPTRLEVAWRVEQRRLLHTWLGNSIGKHSPLLRHSNICTIYDIGEHEGADIHLHRMPPTFISTTGRSVLTFAPFSCLRFTHGVSVASSESKTHQNPFRTNLLARILWQWLLSAVPVAILNSTTGQGART